MGTRKSTKGTLRRQRRVATGVTARACAQVRCVVRCGCEHARRSRRADKPMSRRIAFLGLGKMGLPMATNLAKAHAVTCFDPTAGALADAAAAGLASAASAAEAAAAPRLDEPQLARPRPCRPRWLAIPGLLLRRQLLTVA